MQRLVSTIRKWWPDFNSTVGFFILSVFLVTLKTYWAYQFEFSLGATGALQQFLLILNPIPTAIILLSIALYFRGRIAYWLMMLINLLQTVWLFANILYYREFSDFISLNIVKAGGSVDNNLSKAIGGIIKPIDFVVYIDLIVLLVLLLLKIIKVDKTLIQKRFAILMTVFGVVLMMVDFGIASKDRSGLLTRTFDNNYIVKYLGLNEYAAYNIVKTNQQANEVKEAKSSDLDKIKAFTKQNKVLANATTFGKAKGKNVIIFHLESFQQFMLDYRWDGQEVTPNLNAFYHDTNTTSFDNFYNQVGQGKTSDAELMLENSLYGTASGSVMTNYGTTNTFQAMPSVLDQMGYTTAAFHGDVPSFWNRDNAYKSWGYQYFFSKSYYKDPDNPNYNIGYGLKDKIFLKDTASYLQQLPQPFYAKIITVTNHYPYDLDSQNISIKKTTTGDSTVDGYVQTARYLDQAFGEFESYLKKAGLWNKTMIVLYGDHYGISTNHQPAIAKLLGKKKLSATDLVNWEKVPFMVRVPGMKGGINHTYGGEIDVMPTLLGLLGIKDEQVVQFGTDLLSSEHRQVVPFRNGDWVSSEYTKIGSSYYVTATGTKIKPSEDPRVKQIIKETNKFVTQTLDYNDKLIQGNLLRFASKSELKRVNKKNISYKTSTGIANLKAAQKKGTSVKAKNGGKSTMDKYVTNAPELGGIKQTLNNDDNDLVDGIKESSILGDDSNVSATPESILSGHGSDNSKKTTDSSSSSSSSSSSK